MEIDGKGIRMEPKEDFTIIRAYNQERMEVVMGRK